jgi:hypothetical protein
MRTTLFLLVVIILSVSRAVAQEPPPVPHPTNHQHPAQGAETKPPATPVEAPAPIAIGARVGDSPSGYDAAGRRDPFMSLITTRRTASGAGGGLAPRPQGLPALSLVDVRIAGILRMGDRFVAILEGPDKQSFNARPKDRLLDAVVKSIDATGVVFVEQSDGMGPGREIRKPLRRAEDIR